MAPSLHLSDFVYNLPDERIAAYPLPERDASQLLVYRQGAINHRQFTQLPAEVPAGSLLVFNDTKVIPARLHLETETSHANVEVFLLEPADGIAHADAMQQRGSSVWHVMVGHRRKWKPEEVLQPTAAPGGIDLRVMWENMEENLVRLQWEPADSTLAEVLHQVGETPLPPYIKRKASEEDRARYQTIWAKKEGAVAAPTASLHFTQRVLDGLAANGIGTAHTTLHVGAGTFQPIKVDDVRQHTMHAEKMEITATFLERLLSQTGPMIAVGTTALRVVETVYWLGCKVLAQQGNAVLGTLTLDQEDAYTVAPAPRGEALQALLDAMDKIGVDTLFTPTQLYIRPGYQFRVASGLITNFHQPGSSLIVLIAALLGDDWRRVYDEALANNYRFLSYGDSSLLLPFPLNQA